MTLSKLSEKLVSRYREERSYQGKLQLLELMELREIEPPVSDPPAGLAPGCLESWYQSDERTRLRYIEEWKYEDKQGRGHWTKVFAPNMVSV